MTVVIQPAVNTAPPCRGPLGPADLSVVAHRLPHQFDASAKRWTRSPGGLATALRSALGTSPVRWYGHATLAVVPPDPVASIELRPLVVADDEHALAMDGYANRTLWPALHGIRAQVEHDDAWWPAYLRRARRTATILANEAPHRGRVWFHDYHHFGVPGPLRDQRPDLSIGLFCHTPVDRLLGEVDDADALLHSIAACDHIATQTTRDADALRDLLGAARIEGPPIDAVPVGFDVAQWRSLRADPSVRADAEHLRSMHGGALAVGVDRMDYTKGLVQRLVALELAYATGDISPDDLRLIQVAIPSRSTIPAYAELEAVVTALVASINRQHRRRDGLATVELRTNVHEAPELAVLMRASDLAIVNSIRDGMNLVAAEYATVNADRPVELVLGRGAGIAEHLGATSVVVDGADHQRLADTLVGIVNHRDPEHLRQRSRRRADAAELLTSHRWFRHALPHLESTTLNGARP